MTEVEISLAIEKVDDQDAWRRSAARRLKIPPSRLVSVFLLKKSVDARRAPVVFRLRLAVGLDTPLPPQEPDLHWLKVLPGEVRKVVIVGCGPVGMLVALRSIHLGLQPVVLDRGQAAFARRFLLAPFLWKGS